MNEPVPPEIWVLALGAIALEALLALGAILLLA